MKQNLHLPSDRVDAQTILKLARREASVWQSTSVQDRLHLLHQFKKTLKEDLEDWVTCLSKHEQKTPTDALTSEVMTTLSTLNFLLKNGKQLLKPRQEKTSLFSRGDRAKVIHKPYGVILIFSPWNVPMQLSLIPIFTSLLAGNAIILKPSERLSEAFILQLVAFVRKTLQKVGVSEHLIQIVEGGPTIGQALIQEKPDKIFFTGGTYSGQLVYEQAARLMIPCVLELGGNDALIVCEDAFVERAAKAAVWGALFSGGQACISLERIYVHKMVSTAFIQLVQNELNQLQVGRDLPLELNVVAKNQTVQQVQEALDQGACLLFGDPELRTVTPILLTNIHSNMRVMRDETFGPVLPIQTFESEEDVIELVNQSEYGLNAAIFSRDLKRAERLAHALEVGNCMINNVLTNVSNMNLPFGGRKKSGFGVSHGVEGFYEFTRPFSLTINKGKTTRSINWFPYKEEGLKFLKAFVKFLG